jgi:hypothetical protein
MEYRLQAESQHESNLISSRPLMIRRKIALIALVLTSFALAACTSPTAPSNTEPPMIRNL